MKLPHFMKNKIFFWVKNYLKKNIDIYIIIFIKDQYFLRTKNIMMQFNNLKIVYKLKRIIIRLIIKLVKIKLCYILLTILGIILIKLGNLDEAEKIFK